MSLFRTALGAITLATLAGCVTPPQGPVSFTKEALDPAAGSLAVAMPGISKPSIDYPGAGCLLCLAAASMTNSALAKHADKLTYEDLSKLRTEIVEMLRKRGVNAMASDHVV